MIGTVPQLASQVLGGGYHVEVEADGARSRRHAFGRAGGEGGRNRRPRALPAAAEGDVRPQAAAAVVHAGGALRRLSFEEPSLDAIYNRYFQSQTGVQHAA